MRILDKKIIHVAGPIYSEVWWIDGHVEMAGGKWINSLITGRPETVITVREIFKPLHTFYVPAIESQEFAA